VAACPPCDTIDTRLNHWENACIEDDRAELRNAKRSSARTVTRHSTKCCRDPAVHRVAAATHCSAFFHQRRHRLSYWAHRAALNIRHERGVCNRIPAWSLGSRDLGSRTIQCHQASAHLLRITAPPAQTPRSAATIPSQRYRGKLSCNSGTRTPADDGSQQRGCAIARRAKWTRTRILKHRLAVADEADCSRAERRRPISPRSHVGDDNQRAERSRKPSMLPFLCAQVAHRLTEAGHSNCTERKTCRSWSERASE